MADFDNERLDEYKKIFEDYISKHELEYFNKYLEHLRDYVEKKKEKDPKWYYEWRAETVKTAKKIMHNEDITKEDKEKREKHLRDLYQGKIQGPIQFNPYEFKYASTTEKPVRKLDIHKTYYELYEEYAKEHLDDIAVYIYDAEKYYTHRQILELVEIAKNGLESKGVRESSVVALMLDGSIEQVITPLAVSKIGGIVKFPDYSKHPTVVRKALLESGISHYVIEQRFYDLIPGLKDTLNAAEGLKIIVGETNKDTKRIINYNTIMKLGSVKPSDITIFIRNIRNKLIKIKNKLLKKPKLEAIINSSGTSDGVPKPIGHTKESLNSAIQKMYYTGFPLGRGNVLVKNIPDPVGLGSIISMYGGLLSGSLLVVIGTSSMEDPLADYKNKMREFIKNYLIKYKKILGLSDEAKVNFWVAPEYARESANDDEIKDMSFVGSNMAAGSAMDESDLNEKDASNREKGCKVPITVFFGHNETCGPITGNTNELNRAGTQGFPVKDVDVMIVDPKTYEPLPIGEEGLILERTNSLFDHYPGMSELTQKVKIRIDDNSNEDWYYSGDYGYLDTDGRLIVVDRGDNYVIIGDYKFPMRDTVVGIKNIPQVEDCAIIKTVKGTSYEKMAAFVKINDSFREEDRDNIARTIFNCPSLLEKQIPSEVIFLDEGIPQMISGKPNLASLSNIYYEGKGIHYKKEDFIVVTHHNEEVSNPEGKVKTIGKMTDTKKH